MTTLAFLYRRRTSRSFSRNVRLLLASLPSLIGVRPLERWYSFHFFQLLQRRDKARSAGARIPIVFPVCLYVSGAKSTIPNRIKRRRGMPCAFGMIIFVWIRRNYIDHISLLLIGVEKSTIVVFGSHIVGQENKKGSSVGAQLFQGKGEALFLVSVGVGRVCNQGVVCGNRVVGNVSIEVPTLVDYV